MESTMRKVEHEKLTAMFGSLDDDQIRILLTNIPDHFINEEFKRRIKISEDNISLVSSIINDGLDENESVSYIDEIDKIIEAKERIDKKLDNINKIFKKEGNKNE